MRITKIHVESIVDQRNIMKDVDSNNLTIEALKANDKSLKEQARKENLNNCLNLLPEDLKHFVEQATDKGASSWLNTIPLINQDLDLNKEEFADALRIRYNLPLNDLPSKCACGETFDIDHALICKKGGFISKRHDNIRDILTILLNKVCNNVESEPHLLPVTIEKFSLRTGNTETEALLDMKANGFWRRGQTAFFDVRVTHVNSKTNHTKKTTKIFHEHEQAKKREYMQRVLDIEHASFTPLVFGTNGGMGSECQKFVSALANKLAVKQNEDYAVIISWLGVRLSIEITRSTLLCIRGSRTPFRTRDADIATDFRLNNIESGIA